MISRALSTCIVVTDADDRFAVIIEPPTPGYPTRRFDNVEGAFAFANTLCESRGWTVFDMTKSYVEPQAETHAKSSYFTDEVRARISAAVKAYHARRKAALEAESATS